MTKQTANMLASSLSNLTKDTAVRPRETKIGNVIALLARAQGATLDEMVEATGWLSANGAR